MVAAPRFVIQRLVSCSLCVLLFQTPNFEQPPQLLGNKTRPSVRCSIVRGRGVGGEQFRQHTIWSDPIRVLRKTNSGGSRFNPFLSPKRSCSRTLQTASESSRHLGLISNMPCFPKPAVLDAFWVVTTQGSRHHCCLLHLRSRASGRLGGLGGLGLRGLSGI